MFIEAGLRLAARTRDRMHVLQPSATGALDDAIELLRSAIDRVVPAAALSSVGDRIASVTPAAGGLRAPRTLDAVLRERGALGPATTSSVVLSLGAALDALHAGDAAHGDLRPANVLVFPHGRARLLAPTPGSRRGLRPVLVGYVAPETIDGGRRTARSDIYGLGAIAYEMLAGRPAYPLEEGAERVRARIRSGPPRLGDEVPGIAENIAEVVARAMSADPDMRQESAGAFALALARAVGAAERTQALHRVALPVALPRWHPDWRRLTAALPPALVVLGVIVMVTGAGDTSRSQAPVVAAQVSTASTPTPSAAAAMLRTPNVVGLRANDAAKLLREAGFRNDVRIVTDPAARGRRSSVVRQEPLAGTAFEPGARATLFIIGPYED